MRTPVLLICVALSGEAAAITGAPFSKAGALGVGVGGSSLNSGLTAKKHLSDGTAAQITIGSTYSAFGLFAAGDLVFDLQNVLTKPEFGVALYAGAGATVALGATGGPIGHSGAFAFGVQGVLGVGAYVREIPLEVVLEYRPALFVVPLGVYWGWVGGAIRYYF